MKYLLRYRFLFLIAACRARREECLRLSQYRHLFPLAALALSGCHSTHSPTVDVIGSYFPAWIICIVSGLFLTIFARQIFIGFKVDKYLHPAPLIYLCLMIGFTLLVWLTFFKN